MSYQLCLIMPGIRNQDDLPMRDCFLVVALVVLAHVLVLWPNAPLPGQARPASREMSVSMMPSILQAEPKQAIKPKPIKPPPVPEMAAPVVPAEAPAPSQLEESAPEEPENASTGLPDQEPDYQAAYLNNPRPSYPMVARRMGWQGRVVLSVEVLESGLPGQIKLHQSSGRDALDNAAIQAVRSWKFVPARKNGQVITKWFLVPIPFILKESE